MDRIKLEFILLTSRHMSLSKPLYSYLSLCFFICETRITTFKYHENENTNIKTSCVKGTISVDN